MTTYMTEMKADGLTAQLTYKGGLLQKAVTRGDGLEGEDIWHTVANIEDIPKKLNKDGGKDVKVIRGEVMVARSEMENLEGYSNPRNAAAGLLRRKDGSGAKHLSFRAFDYWMEGSKLSTEEDKLKYLMKNGFKVVEYRVCKTYDEIVDAWKDMEAHRDTDSDFDADGLVVKVNDCALQDKIQEESGRQEQDDPAWAVAFKFTEKPQVTELLGVEESVGRTGVITPVALLKPVKIGGVTVARASLCNWEEVERLGIQVGDQVNVVRSGEVIPKVVGVHKKGSGKLHVARTAKCPVCGTDTVEDGPRQMCPNPACPAQVGGMLENWCKKRDILGLGPAQIDKLMSSDVDSIVELYEMDEQNWIDALESEAVGTKVYKEVQRSRKCTLSEFVGSVGIVGLGRRECEMLLEKTGYKTLDELLESLTYNDLLQLPGYKKTKAMKIVDGLQAAADILRDVHAHMKIEKPVEATSSELSNMVCVFTGVRPTKDEEQQFVAKGGKIASGVSKTITHLVQKDASSKSSKSDKAKELGKEVISYAAWQETLK
jgi:DNA ligase (NAD+)